MKPSFETFALAAMLVNITVCQSLPDYTAAPPNLTTLANNSLFDTWRPIAHVLPPYGSIGDPCAHYTDPATGLFHVGWLTSGIAGATTDNMVTYIDLNPNGAAVIVAGGINDPVAVFDGSVMPVGVNGFPTLLYTAVSFLPIQWTINYTRGSETQALAVTSDGGKNFTKLTQGSVIPDPPFGMNVTGFRDPYVFQSPTIDLATGSANDTWYTTVSGGVHGVGPCVHLYKLTDPAFEYWEYLGKLYNEPMNSTWGTGGWAGRFGFNFEVGNFIQLDGSGYSETGDVFLSMGAEWSTTPIVPQVSDFRESLWVSGNISTCDGSPQFTPNMVGKLDWGTSAYAAAGKILPAFSQASVKSDSPDRFILWIWLTSNFFGTVIFPSAQFNWSSSLLLPRELSVGYINNVIYNDLVSEVGSWRVAGNNNDGTVNLSTMKQVIVREALAAMKSNATTHITQPGMTIAEEDAIVPFTQSPGSQHWLLTTSITFPSGARGSNLAAGLQIFSSAHEATSIYYQFSNESLIIDRSNSSAAAAATGIYHANEAGKFRLFDVSTNGTVEMETMQLTIVADGGIVEVHVNDRFAVSTWVFPWYAVSRNISFLVQGAGSGDVTFGEVDVWVGLYDAWPERIHV